MFPPWGPARTLQTSPDIDLVSQLSTRGGKSSRHLVSHSSPKREPSKAEVRRGSLVSSSSSSGGEIISRFTKLPSLLSSSVGGGDWWIERVPSSAGHYLNQLAKLQQLQSAPQSRAQPGSQVEYSEREREGFIINPERPNWQKFGKDVKIYYYIS